MIAFLLLLVSSAMGKDFREPFDPDEFREYVQSWGFGEDTCTPVRIKLPWRSQMIQINTVISEDQYGTKNLSAKANGTRTMAVCWPNDLMIRPVTVTVLKDDRYVIYKHPIWWPGGPNFNIPTNYGMAVVSLGRPRAFSK